MIKQVDFAFRTLDSDGEETYQNTGISMKGSPDADWDQFLYDRGSSKGQVVDELTQIEYSESPQYANFTRNFS